MEIAIEVEIRERTATELPRNLWFGDIELGGVCSTPFAITAHVDIHKSDMEGWDFFNMNKTFMLYIVSEDYRVLSGDFYMTVQCKAVLQKYAPDFGAESPHHSHIELKSDGPDMTIILGWDGKQMPFKYGETYTAILREKALI